MNPVRRLREQAAVTQTALAEAGGTSQPTIAAYEAGRTSPTLATIERLAASVGLEAVVTFVPPLTREDRRSLFLHRAIVHALESDPDRVMKQARRSLRLMMKQNTGAMRLLREWRLVLDGSPAEVAAVLLDPGLRSRELRHVTPFTGILSASERTRIYKAFSERERKERDS